MLAFRTSWIIFYIRFGIKLCRQIYVIPMDTKCAPLIADLFLFRNERNFMLSLSSVKQFDIIEAFNSTSVYLQDYLNIDNLYFEGMISQINPPKLELNSLSPRFGFTYTYYYCNGFASIDIYNRYD